MIVFWHSHAFGAICSQLLNHLSQHTLPTPSTMAGQMDTINRSTVGKGYESGFGFKTDAEGRRSPDENVLLFSLIAAAPILVS